MSEAIEKLHNIIIEESKKYTTVDEALSKYDYKIQSEHLDVYKITDSYDFSSKKGLKAWERDLGIQHKHSKLPWERS